MAKDRNCPNCGGTTEGYFCPYCGTALYGDSDILYELPGRVAHAWIRDDEGRIMCFDIEVERAENSYEDIVFVSDQVCLTSMAPKLEITGRLLRADGNEWTDVLTKAGVVGGDI